MFELTPAIARTRAINYWGEENARLDSLQGVNEFHRLHSHPDPVLGVIEALFFFGPEVYFNRLTTLWNGRIVYARCWEVFLEEMRTEWGRMATFVSPFGSCFSMRLLTYDGHSRLAFGCEYGFWFRLGFLLTTVTVRTCFDLASQSRVLPP